MEVACAEPSRQVVRRVSVPPGTTLREAVEASGVEGDFPDLGVERLEVGVFGRRLDPGTAVRPGDRVELYRPLAADPRELRRARARSSPRRGGPGRRGGRA